MGEGEWLEERIRTWVEAQWPRRGSRRRSHWPSCSRSSSPPDAAVPSDRHGPSPSRPGRPWVVAQHAPHEGPGPSRRRARRRRAWTPACVRLDRGDELPDAGRSRWRRRHGRRHGGPRRRRVPLARDRAPVDRRGRAVRRAGPRRLPGRPAAGRGPGRVGDHRARTRDRCGRGRRSPPRVEPIPSSAPRGSGSRSSTGTATPSTSPPARSTWPPGTATRTRPFATGAVAYGLAIPHRGRRRHGRGLGARAPRRSHPRRRRIGVPSRRWDGASCHVSSSWRGADR